VLSQIVTSRFKRLAKEGIWITVGQITVVLGALVLVRVLTELLTPAEFGQLTIDLTFVALFGQVVFGGLSQGITRYYSVAFEKHDLHGYLVASLRLLLYGSGVSIAVCALVAVGIISLGYSHWLEVALAATLLAILYGCNSTLNGIQNAARQRAIVAMHSGLDAWLKIGLAVVLLFWLGTSRVSVILGFAASALLVTLSQLIFLRHNIRALPVGTPPLKVREWVVNVWIYSWPFSTWGVFIWMQQVSDRWALGIYESTQDVGYYAVVFQLGYTPIALVLGLATTFLAPILFNRAGDATSPARNENVARIIWRITLIALMVTGVVVLATSYLHQWLFSILVAAEFRWISYLLPWVILAGGIFAAGQMLSLKLMSEMKARELLFPKIATSLIGVGLNFLGAAIAGIEGVVVAMIAFSVIYCVWIILLVRQKSFVSDRSSDIWI